MSTITVLVAVSTLHAPVSICPRELLKIVKNSQFIADFSQMYVTCTNDVEKCIHILYIMYLDKAKEHHLLTQSKK
jgi:hypothetical protein